MNFIEKVYNMTGVEELIASPSIIIMLIISLFLLYLGIKKKYEPLLLVPIGFGMLLANLPGANLGVSNMLDNKSLIEIAQNNGIINFLYYALIKSGFLPPIIFMGVGALTDFGPMLKNLRLVFFGAAAQIGIFIVLVSATLFGLPANEAASIAIIGGADGPTAIYTSIILAPHLLGPIAIAAYSYMALVPVIIPFVVKYTVSKNELNINMKKQDEKFPSSTEIKNIDTLKILFPIIITILISIIVPSAAPLIGLLMFGNLIKEIGSATGRLSKAASDTILNSSTIFLGLTIGATMTHESFLNFKNLSIIVGGLIAFVLSVLGGILAVKIFNLFL